uniref:(northern house mosquito) hypothetical protein n=1 Tax=Culex pipiens TaxID=7175 RepID=A0A8D8B1A8_CULPI
MLAGPNWRHLHQTQPGNPGDEPGGAGPAEDRENGHCPGWRWANQHRAQLQERRPDRTVPEHRQKGQWLHGESYQNGNGRTRPGGIARRRLQNQRQGSDSAHPG